MLACFSCLLLFLFIIGGCFTDDEIVYHKIDVGTKITLDYNGSGPLYYMYAVQDTDSRMDFTLWSDNNDMTLDGKIYSCDTFSDACYISSISPGTTTIFRAPEYFHERIEEEEIPIYIKVMGDKNKGEDKVNLILSDGVYLLDSKKSSQSVTTNFYGDTRYYKFFVCDSDEPVNVTFISYIPSKEGDVSLYISKTIGRPNGGTCNGKDECLVQTAQAETEREYTYTIAAEKITEPGWLYASVKVPDRNLENLVSLSFENGKWNDPYPEGNILDKMVCASNLCLYEFCMENFQFLADTTKSLAVSAWNDNKNHMLLAPLSLKASVLKNNSEIPNYKSANGFIYISQEEMGKLFDVGDNDTTLYFRVNNQIPIPFPSLGKDVHSPIRFGICQDCTPLYPHGQRIAFKGDSAKLSHGHFIIPFATDLRLQPIYKNIKRDLGDPNSPLRPIYAFTFRNYKIENNDNNPELKGVKGVGVDYVENKCPWEFLISTKYYKRTNTIEDDKFDAIAREVSKNGGGSGIEITPTTRSLLDGERFYTEEMTVFGHMYPYDFGGSTPNYCSSDVNYIYVADVHEMNPVILDGVGSNIETEISYKSQARDDGTYYPLHLKVTLTDDLKKDDSRNFLLTVVPDDSNYSSILIVGSSSIILPDPDFDNEILSNGGSYVSRPYVTISGSEYKNADALYFTINFLTPSSVTVKFSREDKIIMSQQGQVITSSFLKSEYLLMTHFDATVNNFSQAFFAAAVTNKEEGNAHHGFSFCANEDMTTKPTVGCASASRKSYIASNTNKFKDTILKDLSNKMSSSASYIRLMEHPGYKDQNGEATYQALFSTYIELDGTDIKNDIRDFIFDGSSSPIFFKMYFSGNEDGLIRFKPGSDLAKNDDENAKIDIIVCPDFPPISKTMNYEHKGCFTDVIRPTQILPKSISFKLGDNIIGNKATTLWCALFPTSIKAGGVVTIDFSQSTFLSETTNNLISLGMYSTSYGFGIIPRINTGDDDIQSKTMKYIVQASSLNYSGKIYYSQTEIHPTSASVSAQYSLNWPGSSIIPLERSVSERIYFGFKLDNTKELEAPTSVKVNVNFVYAPEYTIDPLNYHPSITSEDPLFAYYDVTPGTDRDIPHGSISYYFYPYNTLDGTLDFKTDIFANTSSFTLLSGDSINDVGNKNIETKYKSKGKGIQVMTIPVSDLEPDVDKNYHVYFGLYKDSDAVGPNPTIATVIFDIVNTSYKLTSDSPITDTIWANSGFFKQNTGLDYVPVFLNYKASIDVQDAQILIETCVFNPPSDGTHKLCYAKYVHNPGPGINHTENCVSLNALGEDYTLKLSSDYRTGYNTFFGIHSGIDSVYQITVRENLVDKRPRTIDYKIGHTDFVKNESVVLKVAPMYVSDSMDDQVLADLDVYYISKNSSNISHTNACGYTNSGNRPLLSLSKENIEYLLNSSQDQLVPLEITFEKLNSDETYYVAIVASHNGFSNMYDPIELTPNKGITGVDVTPSSIPWFVWLIVAVVLIAAVALVLVYIFYWKPKHDKDKQYQEINEENQGNMEGIVVDGPDNADIEPIV